MSKAEMAVKIFEMGKTISDVDRDEGIDSIYENLKKADEIGLCDLLNYLEVICEEAK